jgi:hypothetical protein
MGEGAVNPDSRVWLEPWSDPQGSSVCQGNAAVSLDASGMLFLRRSWRCCAGKSARGLQQLQPPTIEALLIYRQP